MAEIKLKRGPQASLTTAKVPISDGSLLFGYNSTTPTAPSTMQIDQKIGNTTYRNGIAVSSASTAYALGSCSLQNITDAISNAKDKSAVTNMGTATDSTVVLTTASGSSITKVINNVSEAATASSAKNSNQLGGYGITTLGTGTSATYNSKVPVILSGGVLEIGRYIDFHGDSTTRDYSIRLDSGTANNLTFTGASATTLTAAYFNGNAKYAVNAGTATYANNSAALGGTAAATVLNAFSSISGSDSSTATFTRVNGGTVSFVVNNVSQATNAYSASTANRILDDNDATGKTSYSYSQVVQNIKNSLGSINADTANRLWHYSPSSNIVNSLWFFSSGQANSAPPTYFPSYFKSDQSMATTYSDITGNDTIVHIAGAKYNHDLVFSDNTISEGIVYFTNLTANAGTPRYARIVDSANYATVITNLNTLTMKSTLTANNGVNIDGGSYSSGTTMTGSTIGTATQNIHIEVQGTTLVITTK